MRGISDTGLPTAEEALAKYYKRMSKLEKKLNQKLEDQRMRRQGLGGKGDQSGDSDTTENLNVVDPKIPKAAGEKLI